MESMDGAWFARTVMSTVSVAVALTVSVTVSVRVTVCSEAVVAGAVQVGDSTAVSENVPPPLDAHKYVSDWFSGSDAVELSE